MPKLKKMLRIDFFVFFFGVKKLLDASNKPFPIYFDPSEVLEPFIEVTLKWMKIIDFGVQFGEGRVNSWSV